MFEVLFCSLITILPDFLIRRFLQGKRIGKEITLFSVWYELRWGITACIMLTVLMITTIFYYHPATTVAASYYRVIPVLPDAGGRVSEIYVKMRQDVKAGDPLFKLDSADQEAALNSAKLRIAEIDAKMELAKSDIAAAEGQIQLAAAKVKQTEDELRTKLDLQKRNSGTVTPREIEKLNTALEGDRGQLAAAQASKDGAIVRLTVMLPAEKETAQATLAKAQIDLGRTVIRAGVDGSVEQFVLRVGDMVNPMMRPAGLLIPKDAGRRAIQAGFDQLEAQVLKPGMVGEAACVSRPMEIIPLVVTGVQDYLAQGQVRAGEQLIDVSQAMRPGTIAVNLEPLYEGGLAGLPPGSNCAVNVYSSFHDQINDPNTSTGKALVLHVIEATGVVHAAMLRIQALLLPIKLLVLSDH